MSREVYVCTATLKTRRTNMFSSKKPIFWRRASSKERTEEPQEKPKEGNAEQEGLVLTLRNRVSDQQKELDEQFRVIGALRDNLLHEQEVQRKLNEKNLSLIQEKNELRTSLKQAQFHHQTANMQIMDLQKIIREKDIECKKIEAHYNYVLNILRVRLRELRGNREELEAALQDRINNLNRKCIDLQKDKKEEEQKDKKEEEQKDKNQLEYASARKLKKLVVVGVGVGVAVAAAVVVGSFIKRG